MKLKKLLIVLNVMLFFGSISFASEIDILVKKMVEKGIITAGEAQEIMTLTNEEIKSLLAKAQSPSTPAWVQKINVKGDFRLREQWDQNENAIDRLRTRIRARVGASALVNDNINVNFGIASGGFDATLKGGEPRSTNQTLENTFQKHIMFIDYADAEYNSGMFTLMGGIIPFKNFLWNPSDLLWDTDLSWQGIGMKIDMGTLFTYAGALILDEISANLTDPKLYVIQEGISLSSEQMSFKLAAAYYAFDGLKGYRLDWGSGTNTINANPKSLLAYDYDSFGLGIEIGIKDALFPAITLFGESVYCPDSTQTGMLAGLRFGDEKCTDCGQWQVMLSHRRLMKDAWVDAFPDSDAYGGKTNAFVHEIIVNYGLGAGTMLSLDYYFGQKLDSSSAKQHLLQMDLNFSF